MTLAWMCLGVVLTHERRESRGIVQLRGLASASPRTIAASNDPTHFGECFAGRGDEAHGVYELGGLLSWRRPQELHVPCGRGVAGREHGLLVDERVALVARAFERAAVPLEHDDQRGVGPRGDLGDLVTARRRQRVEDERALRVAHVHAIERQRVEVDVQAQRAVAPLDEGHRAHLRLVDAAQAQMPLRAPTQRARQRAEEHPEHLRAKLAVIGQRVAQGPRERAHPLPYRLLREHLVDQVRRDVRHPPAHARGTEAPPLARKCHPHLVAALAAREPHHPVLEEAAAQVLLELPHHETRQAALLLGPLEKPWPVLAHQRVQQRLLRTSPRVPVRAVGLPALAARRASHDASSVRVIHRCVCVSGQNQPSAESLFAIDPTLGLQLAF